MGKYVTLKVNDSKEILINCKKYTKEHKPNKNKANPEEYKQQQKNTTACTNLKCIYI